MCDIPVISSFLVPERCSPPRSLFCSVHPSFSYTLTYTSSSVLPTHLLREPDSAGLLGQRLANSVQRSRQCAPARTTGRFHELRLQHMELCIGSRQGDVMRDPGVGSWHSEFNLDVLLAFWAPGLTDRAVLRKASSPIWSDFLFPWMWKSSVTRQCHLDVRLLENSSGARPLSMRLEPTNYSAHSVRTQGKPIIHELERGQDRALNLQMPGYWTSEPPQPWEMFHVYKHPV